MKISFHSYADKTTFHTLIVELLFNYISRLKFSYKYNTTTISQFLNSISELLGKIWLFIAG